MSPRYIKGATIYKATIEHVFHPRRQSQQQAIDASIIAKHDCRAGELKGVVMTPSTTKGLTIIVSVLTIGFALSDLIGSARAEDKPPVAAGPPVGKTDSGDGTNPKSTPPPPPKQITGTVPCTTTPGFCTPSLLIPGTQNCTPPTTKCP
jgi:hypothetical protein